MRLSSAGFTPQLQEGDKGVLNSELWHACAGPLVSLPAAGSRVVYFPQGHSEQVVASTNKEVDAHIPSYPSLPPQLICQLHNLTIHADVETDEVYAQMTLQPLSQQEQKDAYLPADLGAPSKQPTNYFCKTLTASDTSTHGGFSVPRRAAEKVFPPLDFTLQPPCQELVARDLHDNEWKFRHIFRGQPKRHLLTTGWSVFVSAKRLVAGDAVLFIWNDKNQLLLGIRRVNRPQTVMPSSVLSSDSMHLGLLAAAAHAAATNSRFTIFFNPRASPTEFVIPLVKYVKAVYHTRVSVGMRFRMLFETEESSVRRYMGTITGISDLDSVRWANSHWRSVKVGWDESTTGERQPRVSLWEIEPLTTFPMYPSPFPLRLKRPWPPGLPSLHGFKEDELGMASLLNFQGMGVTPWMQPRHDASMLGLQPDIIQAMASAALQEMRTLDPTKHANPSFIQFQQPQGVFNGTSCLMQSQMYQQSQSQQAFLQGIQENQAQAQAQAHAQAQAQAQVQAQAQAQANVHAQVHQQGQAQAHAQIQAQAQAQAHSQAAQAQAHSHGQTQAHSHGQTQAPSQSQHLQQQLQRQHSFNYQQRQSPSPQPQQHKLVDRQQSPTVVSSMSQIAPVSQPQLQPISSLSHQQSFSDSSGHFMSSPIVSPLQSLMGSYSQHESSHMLNNFPRTSPLDSSSAWPSKRMAVEQMNPLHSNVSQNYISLPPFPGRECALDQGNTDPQSHLLFGVNIEPSSPFLMQSGMSNLGGIGSDNVSTTLPPFCSSNFMSNTGTYFPLDPSMTPSSCIDESGYLQSPENGGHVNPPTRTFVKVYKLGSFGRSLDIAKFSSYQELRSELGRMFGLEGQLEDPLGSGWQLVFVDRENDVLLLGDDPWPEFVNSVWCIKILSPQEVQEMGKQGLELLNSLSIQRLSNTNNNSCDDFVSQQHHDSRNVSTGITTVGSLDFCSI